MKKKHCLNLCLLAGFGLAACSPHIDPITSTPRTVLLIIPMTDDINSSIAFLEAETGAHQTTPGLGKLDKNRVEFFPEDTRTVTYLINGQTVKDREVVKTCLRANTITSIQLVEDVNRTHQTFSLRIR